MSFHYLHTANSGRGTEFYMDITQEVGARIRYYRTEKKISQEKLSEISSLHPSYIGQLERGEKTPSIETIYKITRGLDMSLTDFFHDFELVTDDYEETYALKAYRLIEYQPARTQKKLYNVINEILTIID